MFFVLQESLLEEFGLFHREIKYFFSSIGLILRVSKLLLGKAKLVLSNFELVAEGSDLNFMLAACITSLRKCRVRFLSILAG